ncbi:hypothetical protein BCR37DRAFT_375884 [Protomyces lactucae-debilis]|uniref:Uncharacterized protein n=1 Tax=Protomyces lactucae-debilis TaxID=2754530 RepID=A0A1Y2FV78_PROLT|nr:uncharacterized protein BCR37DRAFT_375884 [Protomyces lactucae-debilis]ORY87923.1 hypothetical protein BCR37DRAFT_375884 [Protomyces lactucae-debilis]
MTGGGGNHGAKVNLTAMYRYLEHLQAVVCAVCGHCVHPDERDISWHIPGRYCYRDAKQYAYKHEEYLGRLKLCSLTELMCRTPDTRGGPVLKVPALMVDHAFSCKDCGFIVIDMQVGDPHADRSYPASRKQRMRHSQGCPGTTRPAQAEGDANDPHCLRQWIKCGAQTFIRQDKYRRYFCVQTSKGAANSTAWGSYIGWPVSTKASDPRLRGREPRRSRSPSPNPDGGLGHSQRSLQSFATANNGHGKVDTNCVTYPGATEALKERAEELAQKAREEARKRRHEDARREEAKRADEDYRNEREWRAREKAKKVRGKSKSGWQHDDIYDRQVGRLHVEQKPGNGQHRIVESSASVSDGNTSTRPSYPGHAMSQKKAGADQPPSHASSEGSQQTTRKGSRAIVYSDDDDGKYGIAAGDNQSDSSDTGVSLVRYRRGKKGHQPPWHNAYTAAETPTDTIELPLPILPTDSTPRPKKSLSHEQSSAVQARRQYARNRAAATGMDLFGLHPSLAAEFGQDLPMELEEYLDLAEAAKSPDERRFAFESFDKLIFSLPDYPAGSEHTTGVKLYLMQQRSRAERNTDCGPEADELIAHWYELLARYQRR